LYEQYVDMSKGGSSLQWLLNNVAVVKLKDTSSAVVRQMRKLLDDSEPQDIPLNLWGPPRFCGNVNANYTSAQVGLDHDADLRFPGASEKPR
jgi:hypothetical protein